MFSRFELAEMVVTNNGTCFVSSEFKVFLQGNGVKHTMSAPYHLVSNGLAERVVQTVKQGLKKVKDGTMSSRLAKVLFTYCITPQSITGLASAELMLGRRPHTCLDLLKPNMGRGWGIDKSNRKHNMTHMDNLERFVSAIQTC